ncbi:extracellular phytase [Dacryopinax primogenitus]|uniref:alkaline phosphatase n=1 Tax=Dacryopinax primogenitus (strain DJM 731) TaxID=1858805 RepID=M5FP36_DACPD|nr:extracellular phytase [Dacryopinax primogenitus]EJT98180.1 extracellular phytase [Dacryopinax primogenitus]
MLSVVPVAVSLLSLAALGGAQTFQRLGTCPSLGCIFPPDQTDFLPGAFFDIRAEIHAPVNGSEANGGVPDTAFGFTLEKVGSDAKPISAFFNVNEPNMESWNFTWFEDLFAKDANTPSLVRVASKAWRKVSLNEPGDYVATLAYYNGSKTVANWHVRDQSPARKAKNILLFIGDGMTTNMITAARLMAHKSINGKYQSLMAMDKFPVVGHQMTHSIDSFITDSANSATALYTGHKSTVNALGVYADSSKTPYDDPKVETIAEIFRRKMDGGVGIVSTAFIADATPAALTSHTRDRNQYGPVIDAYLNGIVNYTWTNWSGPDVLFGGGAEQFYPGPGSFQGKDYYLEFEKKGYQVIWNKTAMQAASNDTKTLGIFSVNNMAKWLDRNVYTENLKNQKNSPDGKGTDALDQPGLKEMTVKAMEILQARSGDKGWFMMSEAASIDKQMHTLDYDRALGELLELDDTIRASIEYLRETGELECTQILVTADHGHGFDVFGSVDTKYMNAASTDRQKRGSIGTYQNSGLSQYTFGGNLTYSEGVYFPARWDPRYTLAEGLGAHPDERENFEVVKPGPRLPAVNISAEHPTDFYVNAKETQTGFIVNGTLPVNNDQGVHSLTDVPVYAMGPCQEVFGGTYGNIDIFYGMANCLGLGTPSTC